MYLTLKDFIKTLAVCTLIQFLAMKLSSDFNLVNSLSWYIEITVRGTTRK